ncbi:hypothetical protein BESB_055040 [Besnoitia besnoiti]|uniref:Uncharacterized protein n=1 Tax=Besnoitia besnoiti TaxID=94643 RepID=A0A2A9MJM5_BESBE|nr:hypothetical protein BESB_055040 [Besnoitia besnoiti]PFH35853.1 hypothetical protein BESB_055040 [Besnoitia besnoiti]
MAVVAGKVSTPGYRRIEFYAVLELLHFAVVLCGSNVSSMPVTRSQNAPLYGPLDEGRIRARPIYGPYAGTQAPPPPPRVRPVKAWMVRAALGLAEHFPPGSEEKNEYVQSIADIAASVATADSSGRASGGGGRQGSGGEESGGRQPEATPHGSDDDA